MDKVPQSAKCVTHSFIGFVWTAFYTIQYSWIFVLINYTTEKTPTLKGWPLKVTQGFFTHTVNTVELYKLCSDQNKVNLTHITYIHIYISKGSSNAYMAQTMNYLIARFLICTRSLYTIYIFKNKNKKTLQVILFLSARPGHPVALWEGFLTVVEPR